jgi:CysZ protein
MIHCHLLNAAEAHLMSQNSISQPPVRPNLVSLFIGASYPFRALKLFIALPRLRRYVLLPILLNVVIGTTLYAGLLFAGLEAIDAFLAAVPGWVASASHPQIAWSAWTVTLPDWLSTWSAAWPIPLPHLPTWTWSWTAWLPHLAWPQLSWPQLSWPNIVLPSWLADLPEFGLALFIWLLRLLLVLTLLLITGLILLQFGVFLGAPWYGQLSEELERLQTGEVQIILINPMREAWRAIFYELKKLVLLFGIGLPLLTGQLFPGLGTLISTTGGIALTATLVCLDFVDATLERRRLRFRQKLGLLFQSLPASAGFALVCLGLVSIPFVNLLSIPICVAAGTLFACEQLLPIWRQNKS